MEIQKKLSLSVCYFLFFCFPPTFYLFNYFFFFFFIFLSFYLFFSFFDNGSEIVRALAEREGIPMHQVLAMGDGANDQCINSFVFYIYIFLFYFILFYIGFFIIFYLF